MAWSFKIILFTCLALVTVVCHAYIERYEKTGHEMLSDHWIAYTSKDTKARIKKNELYLSSLNKNRGVSVQQNILNFVNGSILELSADIKCADVVPGKKSWHRARFLLVQNNGSKNMWNTSHVVAALAGTKKWKRYRNFFKIKHGIKKLIVYAQLVHSTGSLWLKNIQLVPVSQTNIYLWAKGTILASWALFALFLIGSCMYYGKKVIVLQIFLVFVFIAIIAATTISGDLKMRILNGIKSLVHGLPFNLSKTGHFCFFALFGLVLSIFLDHGLFFTVMLNILLVAGGTELAQFFIDGRTPMMWDFLIDSSGGLTGMALCRLFYLFNQEFFLTKSI